MDLCMKVRTYGVAASLFMVHYTVGTPGYKNPGDIKKKRKYVLQTKHANSRYRYSAYTSHLKIMTTLSPTLRAP